LGSLVIIPCLVLLLLVVLGAVVVWVQGQLWQQQLLVVLVQQGQVQLGCQRQWWEVEKQALVVMV
jgi:hypothetical protein